MTSLTAKNGKEENVVCALVCLVTFIFKPVPTALVASPCKFDPYI